MKYKLDVRHRLESLLQESNMKLFVLQSTIDEMRSVGQKATEALAWAQECCEVINDTQTTSNNPLDRYKKILEKKRYFVATQDRDLRGALNSLPGVPVLYLNKVTMVLESPSKASLEYNNKVSHIYSVVFSILTNTTIVLAYRLRTSRCLQERPNKK